MAKYVCDYETARTEVNNILTKVGEMNTTLGEYQTEIGEATSGWNGEAKDRYIDTSNSQVQTIKNSISQVESMANFLNNAINAIQTTDDELAKLTI